LTDKMRWHQARQTLLAENVANAGTPGYTGRDLKPFTIEAASSGIAMASSASLSTNGTSIPLTSFTDTGGFDLADSGGFEVDPGGNSVSLEDEMMKVTSNELDYQTVTTLYTRSLKLIRTALGRSA
jgi:flagellar basal-body rod protein FlgB